MRQSRRFEEESTTTKSIVIFGLIFIMFFSTSIVLTSYPQHLALNDQTVIQAIKFLNNNTALIKGNQVQFGSGDVIPLAGRDYIRITGRQIQIGKDEYNEAVRVVSPSSWTQNTMFNQKIGASKSNQAMQIVIDKTSFNLIPIKPISAKIVSVTIDDLSKKNIQTHYNIQFTQNTTYINENNIMLKIVNENNSTTVYIVGVGRYNNIFFRAI